MSDFASAGRVHKAALGPPRLFERDTIDEAVIAELKLAVDAAFIIRLRQSRLLAGSIEGVKRGCAMTNADPATEAMIRGIEIGRMYERLLARRQNARPLVNALQQGPPCQ